MGEAKRRKQSMSAPGLKLVSCFTNGSKSCDAHTLYLQIIPDGNVKSSSFLPIVKNASIVEAWKVSNLCSEVLAVSEHSFYGNTQEVKEKILESLIENHGLEREKMFLPVIKTWKVFCIKVADPRFPFGRFTIGKSLSEPLLTQRTDSTRCFSSYLMAAYIADFANDNQRQHSLSLSDIVRLEEEAKLLFN